MPSHLFVLQGNLTLCSDQKRDPSSRCSNRLSSYFLGDAFVLRFLNMSMNSAYCLFSCVALEGLFPIYIKYVLHSCIVSFIIFKTDFGCCIHNTFNLITEWSLFSSGAFKSIESTVQSSLSTPVQNRWHVQSPSHIRNSDRLIHRTIPYHLYKTEFLPIPSALFRSNSQSMPGWLKYPAINRCNTPLSYLHCHYFIFSWSSDFDKLNKTITYHFPSTSLHTLALLQLELDYGNKKK